MKTTKKPTTLAIADLRAYYEANRSDAPFERAAYLFLDSTFSLFLITCDPETLEFVALQQQTHGADSTVYEIHRSCFDADITACNDACLRALYFDLNDHLDPEKNPIAL
jgi:hypothetical protein